MSVVRERHRHRHRAQYGLRHRGTYAGFSDPSDRSEGRGSNASSAASAKCGDADQTDKHGFAHGSPLPVMPIMTLPRSLWFKLCLRHYGCVTAPMRRADIEQLAASHTKPPCPTPKGLSMIRRVVAGFFQWWSTTYNGKKIWHPCSADPPCKHVLASGRQTRPCRRGLGAVRRPFRSSCALEWIDQEVRIA